MPEYTSKLEIPLPLGNEYVKRENHRAELQAIEQNAALDPFILKSVSYDSANDRIECVIGKGTAELFNGNARVIIQKTSDTTYYINTPATNTTYYLYLQPDGTFTHDTSGIIPGGSVLLHQVAVGATKDDLTATDRRALISGLAEVVLSHLTDDTKHVTKDGTLQTGLNADQVDGEDSSTLKVNARALSTAKLVVEVSSSAPSSPVNGQIWYDSANHKFRGYANGAWV